MTAVPVRIVKVGGSLLDFPQLVPSLERFLGCQSPAATVMVCGGGPWAAWSLLTPWARRATGSANRLPTTSASAPWV